MDDSFNTRIIFESKFSSGACAAKSRQQGDNDLLTMFFDSRAQQSPDAFNNNGPENTESPRPGTERDKFSLRQARKSDELRLPL
jgi:hypothetical protein